MRKRIWWSRGMVQKGEVLGENPVPVLFLFYKLHKNSTMRGRCLIACTTEQLAQNTRSSFSVLKQRAYLQEYGRQIWTSYTTSVWFNLVRNNVKVSHICHIWNCVHHKPWSCWLRHWTTRLKVAGSIHDRGTRNFHWFNPSGYIMALVSTQPLTHMNNRDISRGVKATGA
jgi:hypothetical protein